MFKNNEPDWEFIRHQMDRKEFFFLAYEYTSNIQSMLIDIDQGLKHHSKNMEAINKFIQDKQIIKDIMREWTNIFFKKLSCWKKWILCLLWY